MLLGAVEVSLDGDTIRAVVEDQGQLQTASITPSLLGRRVVFLQECSCGRTGCVHLAAASFAALDRYPALRKAGADQLLRPDGRRHRPAGASAPGDRRRPGRAAARLLRLLPVAGRAQRRDGADQPAQRHPGHDPQRGGPVAGPSDRRRDRSADRGEGCAGAAGARRGWRDPAWRGGRRRASAWSRAASAASMATPRRTCRRARR